ncbi:FG-GAP repeat domain-containing protein [Streptomyces collinus]|uniref:FG-GAP repeat domain-containing protein n=1 Tax=Streptomyces collinus TaxID=42684 RepID=UPI0036BCEF59
MPFGDLDGDRYNDVLVRMSDGSLRGYKVKCGLAPQLSMAYRKLGTGWNAYDVLTSPGDLTGDGRADLLARRASTGDVYLFAAKSDGTPAAATPTGDAASKPPSTTPVSPAT